MSRREDCVAGMMDRERERESCVLESEPHVLFLPSWMPRARRQTGKNLAEEGKSRSAQRERPIAGRTVKGPSARCGACRRGQDGNK